MHVSISSIGRSGRRTAGVAALLLATSLLAACSSGNGGGTAPSSSSGALSSSSAKSGGSAPPSVDPAKTYNLTYWSWTKGSAEAVDAFNQAHPKIHVTFEKIPSDTKGGNAKIADAFKAGNGPDVFNAGYVDLPTFVAGGQIADISSYLTPQDAADYLPQSLRLVTLGGKKWAVPNDLGATVLFYREDLFAQYGLTVPTTWSQFQDDAQKLATAAPGHYLANYTADNPDVLQGLVNAAGAQWYATSGDTWTLNFLGTETKQVASFWQGMLDKKLVAPVLLGTTGFTADVSNGTILSFVSANWQAAYNETSYPGLKGKLGVALLPSFDGQPGSGVVGGSSYAISKSSKNIPAAVEFAKWMTSDPAAAKARMGGGSSAYFANKTAQQTVRSGFDASYYGGTDIYATFDKAVQALKPWIFGPTSVATDQVIATKLKGISSGTTIEEAISAGMADAKSEMSSLGLNVQVQS